MFPVAVRSTRGEPGGSDGVGIGADAEANTFEPEEDVDATKGPKTD
ncbi:hypothetical protein ACP3TD_18045 [Pseudarthrobacter sp. 1G09]